MWRSVPGRGSGAKMMTDAESAVDDDDDALAKKKKTARVLATSSTTSDHVEAVWIRRGCVVMAGVTLISLFLLSGFLTAHYSARLTTTTITRPMVLSSLHTYAAADSMPTETSLVTTPAAGCNERDARLRVFMYDLPARFHYGMIAEYSQHTWPRNVSALPRYPGGLYQQHSPEYWLVSDLVTSDMPDRTSPCTAYRVRQWRDADVILIPFFASLSYNKFSRPKAGGVVDVTDVNQALQSELLTFLKAQPAWRARAEDHVLVIHHPNSMIAMRAHFRTGIFMVADFGRYGNEGKDVVAPYQHIIARFDADVTGAASFNSRATLLFFQGAIVRKQGGVIRKHLQALLGDEPDVVFATSAVTSAAIRSATTGMRGSKFCLHLAGDTPSSNRLFDAVASGCVPLVVSDEIELPFEDVLDYSEFCLFVKSSDALRAGFVTDLLRNFTVDEWSRMHGRLRDVQRHFQWQHPTELGDAVHMTWDSIARKVPALTQARHKRRRFQRSRAGSRNVNTGENS